jgi:hypothetical protein
VTLSIDRAIEVLTRTPPTLRSLLGGLGPHWTDRPYGEGTWSAHDVVSHLINAERTDWIPRAHHILAYGTTRPVEPFDREGYLAEGRVLPVSRLLDEFEFLRTGSVAALRALSLGAESLDRQGLHPALGPVTLRNLIATWAVHDLNHIAQIAKALAHQCKTEVGPWEAYLSILAPPNPR